MVKKLRQSKKSAKTKRKKPVLRVISSLRSRKPPKKTSPKKTIKSNKKPVKKKPVKKPKFLPIQKKSEAPFIDNEKLPASYDTTGVTLMVRDPYWIHAFWETTPSSVEKAKKKIGASFKKLVYTLRVHDITVDDSREESPHTTFDIDVDPRARNWYINLWRDNVTYFADFGVRTPKGEFYPLARSNTVTTPRATMSEMPDVTWMKAKGKGAYSIVSYPAAQPQTPKQEIPASASGHKTFAKDKPTVPVTDSPQDKNHGVLSQSAPSSHMDSSIPLLKSGSVSAKELPSTDFAGFLFPKPSTPNVLGGSSAYMGGASEQLQLRRDFFFELNTELIVYGRTEPGADVWMGTKKITVLREDGSFSLRCALPEGAVPLDFTAQSNDKSCIRTIITAVHRTPTGYM
jgi:Uncharacterized protein conserved in bacteria